MQYVAASWVIKEETGRRYIKARKCDKEPETHSVSAFLLHNVQRHNIDISIL